MTAVGSLRPFDTTPPEVTSIALSRADTDAARTAAREQRTTVHAALCAAATIVLARQGREFVRIVTPHDLRRHAGLSDGVALRLAAARTGTGTANLPPFWDLARIITADVAPARSVAVVLAGAAMAEDHRPDDADAGEAGMLALSSMDMMLTNLGVVDLPSGDQIHPLTLWGPVMSTRIAGEQVVGAVTSGGQLQLTCTTHDPVPDLLADLAAALVLGSKPASPIPGRCVSDAVVP